MSLANLHTEAIQLLQQLISIPSFSKEEDKTADALIHFMQQHEVETHRYLNNVWAKNKYFNESLPTVILNSHHDTVRPNKGYTLDPFQPVIQDRKLYGLGSNDAGGCLVSLLAVFIHFYKEENLSHNIIFAATAEEEISGVNGIEALLQVEPFNQLIAGNKIAFGIVGEPTLMNMAIAERGLLVLDVIAHGKAGHAARNEGENALYKAVQDINWFRDYRFDKVSGLLGEVKMTVTSINTENKQHNVVPPQCSFIVDVRVNELYSFDEVLSVIKDNVQSEIQPRSTRLRSTSIPIQHPVVQAGLKLNRTYYGSPTTSDKALMPFLTLKMGPGDSARSHTADEFIYVEEISSGIDLYIQLLKQVL